MPVEITEELKPCPFCGGDGLLYQSPTAKALWQVSCKNCDAGPAMLIGEKLARETWNTRAALSQAAEQPVAWEAGNQIKLTVSGLFSESDYPIVARPPCDSRTEALEDLLAATVKAWDELPGDRRYSPKVVESWMIHHMAPAIERLRALSEAGRSALKEEGET